MKTRRAIQLGILLALGSFAGGFFCARATETEVRCTAETFTETRTIVRTVQAEAERSAQATERVIERRIAVPCKCPSAVISKTETTTSLSDETPPSEAAGVIVMDERIFERSVGASERLRLGAFESAAGTVSAESQKAEAPESASLPRWRLAALAGYDWTDAVPVYGLSAGMRLVGPVEIGVWATVSQRLHGAVGLSVSAAW